MKTSSPLFLSFLLFTFSANFLLSSAQSVPAAVLDTTGEELRRGVSYYILPAESGNGGGVSVISERGARCPFVITQDPAEGNNGLPLGFSSIKPNDDIIRLSTDINIKFRSTPFSCPESTVWKFNASQSSSSPRYVTVGGVEGNPRPETVSSWFKIERDDNEDGYQIQFCPSSSFCPPGTQCKFICGNIGIVLNRGFRRLAYVNTETFKVKFLKA